jgi:hypothetical protein
VKNNIFHRIESYAKENFITETLVYIFLNHPSVKKEFLKLIFDNDIKKVQEFEDSTIQTQRSYCKSFIDIEFKAKSGKKIFVENKVNALESDGQIQKYLDLDEVNHVVYLTPIGHGGPSFTQNSDKFLGHFYWDGVFLIIKKYNLEEKNEIISNFLEYLEENNMAPKKPLELNELESGKLAFSFISKCQSILDNVMNKVEENWHDIFGPKYKGSKRARFAIGDEMVYRIFQTKKWEKSFNLYGLIYFSEKKEKPVFCIGFTAISNHWANSVESDEGIINAIKTLKDNGWMQEDHKFVYYKEFPLLVGEIDNVSKDLIKQAMEATTELKQSGIIELLEEMG